MTNKCECGNYKDQINGYCWSCYVEYVHISDIGIVKAIELEIVDMVFGAKEANDRWRTRKW